MRDGWPERVDQKGAALPAAKYDLGRRIGDEGACAGRERWKWVGQPTLLLPAA